MNTTILEDIVMALSEQLSVAVDDITLDSNITGDLGADSLDIVELINVLEEKYQIEVTDEEVMGMLTVENVLDFVCQKLNVVQKSDKDDNQLSW